MRAPRRCARSSTARPPAWTAPGIIQTPRCGRPNQGRVDLLTPVAKGWCTENSILIASTRNPGAWRNGLLWRRPAPRSICAMPGSPPIYEGTTGIQANDLLGRKLVRDKGPNAGALIRDMTAELDALASPTTQTCQRLRLRLRRRSARSRRLPLGCWRVTIATRAKRLPGRSRI